MSIRKNITKLSLLALLATSTASHAMMSGHSSFQEARKASDSLAIHVSQNEPSAKKTQQSISFVKSFADKGIAFLENPDLSEEQKQKEFRALLEDNFDMRTIARFAMGRYWRLASDAQKKEYMNLFQDMVVSVYSQRFSDYQGQKFEVEDAYQDGQNDFIVKSYIVPLEGQKVRVDWRVRIKDGRESVVDVIVEGVSMALTQRSDFSSVIQRGGGQVEVLLSHLRDRTHNS